MTSRKDSRGGLCVLAALVTVVVLAIAAPGASAAVLCGNSTFNGGLSLIDSANNVWDFDSSAEVQDGGQDAFDGFALLFVNNNGTSYDATSGTGSYPASCELEAGGRQIAFPERNSPVAGIKWSRKVYVPATGTPFARWVDFLHNTTGGDIVLTTTRWGGDLGSDAQTKITADSSGNAAIGDPLDDIWTASSDVFTGTDHDPAIGEVWDGPGGADDADHIFTTNTGTTVWTTGQSNMFATYDNVTVPANATIAFMHVLTQSTPSQQQAADFAALLSTGNGGEVFRGLTAGELALIRNWNTADADGDGVANAADNCMTDANANQSNIDGDGAGDACDDDIDGDGVSNANEAARGTDPAKADTDGDGKPDGTDVCPAKAGAGDDGCPPFNSLPAPPVVDKTAPVVTVTVAKKAKRKAFLKGVKAKVACNEACSVLAELSGSAKSVRIAKAYNVLLASKSLGSGTGSRTITLKPNKKFVGTARKFSAQLKLTVTDAAGNVTRKTVVIKVAG